MAERNERPVFKTIKSFEKNYGTRNFIEIALKETNNGENFFFSISKGFLTQENAKRYKKSLGFEASKELQQFFVDSFTELVKEIKKIPETPKAEETKEPVIVKEKKTRKTTKKEAEE